ncbi:MAG: hypothetical protein JWO13_3671 [Acidobacteriales bacterium]|nr:hypothetical protein [Terriglobales bacterium]
MTPVESHLNLLCRVFAFLDAGVAGSMLNKDAVALPSYAFFSSNRGIRVASTNI